MHFKTKPIVYILLIILIIVGGYFLYKKFYHVPISTVSNELSKVATKELKGRVLGDLTSKNTLELNKTDGGYQVTDDLNDQGIKIEFAGQEQKDQPKKEMSVNFPDDYAKPLEVKLDQNRSIYISDNNNANFLTSTIKTGEIPQNSDANIKNDKTQNIVAALEKQKDHYVEYKSILSSKQIFYTFQKDAAKGERQLKNWIVYGSGQGTEKETYKFENAKLSLDRDGNVEVRYWGDQEKQKAKQMADVDQNLLERAQRTLADEGVDMNQQGPADFTIPKAFFVDRNGTEEELDWQISGDDGNVLSVEIKTGKENYPLALDPTLQFTAPGSSNTGDVITGEADNNRFGTVFASGDFNADGKTDLAITAPAYGASWFGRVYIFFNNSVSPLASSADVIITGESGSLGTSLASGDFNADGKTDLAVGAQTYNPGGAANAGRAYIFYGGLVADKNVSSADVIITGAAGSDYFGSSMTAGDFNADGKTDLVVGANNSSSGAGRAYVFLNDGSYSANASSADAIITGQSGYFGASMSSGDFNADGKTDLVVGANYYNSEQGRAYIFYNGSITTKSAVSADVILDGVAGRFGTSFASGDFNVDGKIDLAVGAFKDNGGNVVSGRVYIFNGGNITSKTASSADIKLDGVSMTDVFGYSLAAGDFNSDGKTDLAVGAYYPTWYGANKAYIFYSGNITSKTASSADVIISGSGEFGDALAVGDLNNDGKTDLVVGAPAFISGAGRAYIFYSQDGLVNSNKSIAGASGGSFGWSIASGDFNADGRTDLVVGATGYSSSAGAAYIFYNKGNIGVYATASSGADVVLTGESSSYFGGSLFAGDFNYDGKTDLAVGANTYSSNAGRVYIFNGGSISTKAATAANVILTGESNSSFGGKLTAGDFNVDGKIDLVVGGTQYNSSAGRVYIFNGGNISTKNASSADIILDGSSAMEQLGSSLLAGDFNADGKTDLVVGASGYSANIGQVYIFNGGNISSKSSSSADVTLTGEDGYFGYSLASGDLNSDGKADLVVQAYNYALGTGQVYIFNGGNISSKSAPAADVILTGETMNNYFGSSISTGDFNADGKTDLAVGAYRYNSYTGRTYIFNGGNITSKTASSADIVLTGSSTNSWFGYNLLSGDFNADGKNDLVVVADNIISGAGSLYFYESRDRYAWQIHDQPTMRVSNFAGQEMKVTGETADSNFGFSMAAGDFNDDGKVDLAAGAYNWNSNIGRVYIFYNKGSLPASATGADVVLSGEASGISFGSSIVSGDFNGDGKVDLAVGAMGYISSIAGRTYIFNGGNINTKNASSADAILMGESVGDWFGCSLVSGDFNGDGKVDLAVGSPNYNSDVGRAYVFNGGNITTKAATSADTILTGEGAGGYFGVSLTAGDFNADGKIDLAAGAWSYNSNGRVYVFNGGNISSKAAGSADVILIGETSSGLGAFLAAGDFNADGKTDLAVGASAYNSNQGRVYIFNGGSVTSKTAAGANVIITGETDSQLGYTLTAGDFNNDGKTDLAVGAYNYNSGVGRAYIFNNGNITSKTAGGADVILTGENIGDNFSYSLTAGDFNSDGKTDLAVGTWGYKSGKGAIYMYTMNDAVLTGETTFNNFGTSLAVGDFNGDGKVDLAAGASGYSSSTGRVYIFYNGNITSKSAPGADVILTGEATSTSFGNALDTGDFNADGKTDLAVGAFAYSTSKGRVYVFNGGNITSKTAGGANVILTGENSNDSFGFKLAVGDLNADGKADLVVGAKGYNASCGRAYIFNGGNVSTKAASGADAILTGTSTSSFGTSLATGDFNTDGKTDLAVGEFNHIYIFNGSNITSKTAAGADITLTGEGTGSFGQALVAGDFNADGKTDLAVAADAYPVSYIGRVYIFYGNLTSKGALSADVIMDGTSVNDRFGNTMIAGDFNADGKTDLAIDPTPVGKSALYIYYNKGAYPSAAALADVKLQGESVGDTFGHALAVGDFNNDGKIDLVVGAPGYNVTTGRVYLFTTEAAVQNQKLIDKMKGSFKFKGNFKFSGETP